MDITVREYREADIAAMTEIWNAVVEEGVAFPQTEPLTRDAAQALFAEQSFAGVADEGGVVRGLYILHPNNVGRCGHIANASYAVAAGARGKRIGEKLVRHSIERGGALGFKLLQFNAVVATNAAAIRLYTNLGFTKLGVIPGGFRLKDGSYADILLFYLPLQATV